MWVPKGLVKEGLRKLGHIIRLLPIFIPDEQSDRTNQVLLVCLDEYSYKKKSTGDFVINSLSNDKRKCMAVIN